MNLTLDFGNTRTKACVFDADNILFEQAFEQFGQEECSQILNSYSVDAAIICSVRRECSDICAYLKKKLPQVIELSSETPLPISLAYKTPKTLGTDRIAAVVGAQKFKPNANNLVIDIGTAVTFDLLRADGVFVGGNIAPGAAMRFKALHEFTGRLPLETLEPFDMLLGTDTKSAITLGVAVGITAEIETYVRLLQAEYGELFVFLTGGDCFYFAKRLKIPIFVIPNLLSMGLNSVLNYNLCRIGAL